MLPAVIPSKEMLQHKVLTNSQWLLVPADRILDSTLLVTHFNKCSSLFHNSGSESLVNFKLISSRSPHKTKAKRRLPGPSSALVLSNSLFLDGSLVITHVGHLTYGHMIDNSQLKITDKGVPII